MTLNYMDAIANEAGTPNTIDWKNNTNFLETN